MYAHRRLFAIDIDGTLANTPAGFSREVNSRLGLQVCVEESPYYYPEEIFRRNPAAIDILKDLIQLPEFYLSLDPLPGAAETVRYIASRYPAFYWTARDGGAEDLLTHSWLQLHGFPDLPIAWIPSGPPRADFGVLCGVTDAIEDATHNALPLARQGIRTLVIPWAHNASLEQSNSPYLRRLPWATLLETLRAE